MKQKETKEYTDEEIDNMTEKELDRMLLGLDPFTPTKEYRVVKTVTEYHYFTVEAESQEEAERIADDNDVCYCDSDNAEDTVVEVESVKEMNT